MTNVTMSGFSLERQIEICNAVNTAIAKGYTVKVWQYQFNVGATMSGGKLTLVRRKENVGADCRLVRFVGEQRITAVHPDGTEAYAIHELPPEMPLEAVADRENRQHCASDKFREQYLASPTKQEKQAWRNGVAFGFILGALATLLFAVLFWLFS
jgi:hypothetical protein